VNKTLNINHKQRAHTLQPYLHEVRFYIYYILAGMVFIAGGIYTFFSLKSIDRNLRNDLLNRTRLIALAFNTNRMKALPGDLKDRNKTSFLRMEKQLKILKKAYPDIRLIYLIAKKPSGSFCIFADDKQKENSPAGASEATCSEISLRLGVALQQWQETVLGPFRDPWGDYFSVVVPVHDQLTNEPLAGLGIDFSVGVWRNKMLLGLIPGVAITLTLLIIIFSSGALHRRRNRNATSLKHLDLAQVLLIGIVLSAFIAWRVKVCDWEQQQKIFQQLGKNNTELIAKTINFIQLSELEGLAGFLAHNEEITQQEFLTYTSHLLQNSLVQAWDWIAIVNDSERESFEENIRKKGNHEFRIWQRGPNGAAIPAERRQVYYPILSFAQETSTEKIMGFDLGSEEKRLATIEQTLASGLPTASEPITLIQEWTDKRGIIILHPVFRSETQQIRGFALAAIRGEMLFGRDLAKFKLARLSISFLRPDGSSEILAVSKHHSLCRKSLAVTRPVFAFGQVMTITASPCNAFFTAYPQHRSLAVLLMGLGLSVAVATIVDLVSGRGVKLTALIDERTTKLGKSEARFHLLAEQTRTVLWECHPDGLYKDIGPETLPVFGYHPEELIGKVYFHDLHPPLGREQFTDLILRTFASKKTFTELINPVQTKDGRVILVSTSGMPLFDTQGDLVGYYGSDRDISEREQMTAELEQSRTAAEAANHAKSKFLTNMSHEIRTPINSIVGMADLLKDSNLNQEQLDYVNTIQNSSQMLLSLVNEILDFSRIESGRIKLITNDFDIRQLMEEVTGNLAFTAHSKNLELYCTLNPAFPAILHGDDFHLRQILLNLAGNALKFTEKGEIVLSVNAIGKQADKELFRFAVRDTGIGIPDDQKIHIFDSFFQADSTERRHYGGTGLGLSIVKKLVKFMGGKIGFTSQQGVGSEFYFILPLTRTPACSVTAVLPPEAKHSQVLLIDRYPGTRMELQMRMNSMGISASCAADLAEAEQKLQAAQEKPYQVIILDLELPELLSKKTLPEDFFSAFWREARCIGLSHLKSGLDLGKFHPLHLQRILHKPVKTKELLAALFLQQNRPKNPQQNPPDMNSQASCKPMLVPPPNGIHTIILAEDNTVNQKVVLAILKKMGVHADVAVNGLEVLELLTKKDYALVLMDVQMPEMDGLEATKKIRDPATPIINHQIPIIAVTAHAIDGYKESCLAAGMDDYISKPIRVKQLKDLLERWLGPLTVFRVGTSDAG